MTYSNYEKREQDFGPAAKYSEHARGETITYHMGGEIYTGEIVYILAPQEILGTHYPLTYLVDAGHEFLDFVFQTNVIEC
jgi:hypothetical protein